MAAFCAAEAKAAPAHPATVGDGTVDASRLQPYDNAFSVSQIGPGGAVRMGGVWTDHLRRSVLNGRPVFVRTQSFAYEDGSSQVHVNTFDPVTFAPIRNFQHNRDGGTEAWTFEGLHVEGLVTAGAPGAKPETQRLDVKVPSFDFNCCMRSLVPAAIKLRAGETVAIRAAPVSGDPEVIVYRVLRREPVDAGWRGKVDAWVLETDIPGVPGGLLHFWIADEAPYLVRMTLIGTVTSSGEQADQSFDMLGARRPATLN